MEILAALFFEGLELRPASGGVTKIDLTGIHFSMAAPTPVPLTVAPHLMVLVHCPEGASPTAALEVIFTKDGERVARNAQSLQVEPGRFGYRLVRAEVEIEDYGTIEAHCRVDQGPVTVVPFTILPPVPADPPSDPGPEAS
ncbi:MAG: hypothetical protein VX268_03950 [Actinomycetota bacterium]|nr:hypothetical protein [Actinomycetota bacterium]